MEPMQEEIPKKSSYYDSKVSFENISKAIFPLKSSLVSIQLTKVFAV